MGQKIIYFLFLSFLGLFSLGEVIRFNFGSNLFIKPLDIVMSALALFWFFTKLKSLKKIIFKDPLFIPIALFMFAALISLAFNFKNFSQSEIVVAFSYILRWGLYSSLYFIVKSFSPKFKSVILYLLLAIGILIVLFGFIQYFFYSNLRNLYYLGWDEHMHRMFSTFLDPNFAGAFFVLFLIFLSGILLYLLKNIMLKQAWIIGLISIFTLISIFLTYSRSALIMLIISTIIFSILTKKIKFIFVILLISIGFIAISSKNFNIENVNLFRIASTEARIDSAKIAIEIIRENPVFGVGFNTYRYAQIKYGFRNAINANVSHADAGTDNSFLFILATMGIVGLIAYCNLLYSVLRMAYFNYSKHKAAEIQKYISLVVIVSIGGIIINSFFINSLFYSFVMIWMWILVGLIENK